MQTNVTVSCTLALLKKDTAAESAAANVCVKGKVAKESGSSQACDGSVLIHGWVYHGFPAW